MKQLLFGQSPRTGTRHSKNEMKELERLVRADLLHRPFNGRSRGRTIESHTQSPMTINLPKPIPQCTVETDFKETHALREAVYSVLHLCEEYWKTCNDNHEVLLGKTLWIILKARFKSYWILPLSKKKGWNRDSCSWDLNPVFNRIVNLSEHRKCLRCIVSNPGDNVLSVNKWEHSNETQRQFIELSFDDKWSTPCFVVCV